MATAYSEASGSQPYVYCTFTGTSHDDRMTYAWSFYYHASYAISTGTAKPVHAWIKGSAQSGWTTLDERSYSINGKTGNNLIASGTVDIPRTHSSQTVEVYVRIEFGGVVYSGVTLGTRNGTETVTIGAKTSYAVNYDANGGSGAPESQVKWYNESMTLSSVTPTRSNYNFTGWNTQADGSGVDYTPGQTYTVNSQLGLYAKWELALTAPRISNMRLYHSDSVGNPSDTGTYLACTATIVPAQRSGSYQASGFAIKIGGTTVGSGTTSASSSYSLSGVLSGTYSADNLYTAQLSVSYTYGGQTVNATASATAAARFYTLDFRAGGKGIGIGQRATADKLQIAMNTDWAAGSVVKVGTVGGGGELRVGGYGVTTVVDRCYCKGSSSGTGTTPTTSPYKAQITLASGNSKLGVFTIDSGGIVCPRSGRVRIDASVYYDSVAARNRGCYIHKNGTEVVGVYCISSAPNLSGVEIDVSANDVLTLWARGTSTSETYYTGQPMTYIRVEYLRRLGDGS